MRPQPAVGIRLGARFGLQTRPRVQPGATPLLLPLRPTDRLRYPPSSVVASSVRWNSSNRPDKRPIGGEKTQRGEQNGQQSKSFGDKLGQAWSTPTKWYPIPIALGALVLLAVQMRKQSREDALKVESQREGGAVVRSTIADGPWQVRVMGALPLRSLSQLWGYLNSLVLPVWFRPFGFKLYSSIFGCNLEECTPEDLTQYESLGEFFYRELKPGMRPIADAPMVSPADGRVLHFGEIVGEQVEQVKGMTYSLQALLGSEGEEVGERTEIPRSPRRSAPGTPSEPDAPMDSSSPTPHDKIQRVEDENFARINDIPYSLQKLMGRKGSEVKEQQHGHAGANIGGGAASSSSTNTEEEHDASLPSEMDLKHDASVAFQLGTTAIKQATDKNTDLTRLDPNNRLYFLVVYLAPGDYHRFHSPTAWVVERRRHFTGDLFSVSPYIANRLRDLFVLNERVALLGRWKYGFYSMVPVGATNVGSIRINFDDTLRTNTRQLSHPAHTFTEAVYASASLLGGQPLLAGEEMGGFRLGSTIVLVFEAPKEWRFTVAAGEKIKVGQQVGTLEPLSPEEKQSQKQQQS